MLHEMDLKGLETFLTKFNFKPVWRHIKQMVHHVKGDDTRMMNVCKGGMKLQRNACRLDVVMSLISG